MTTASKEGPTAVDGKGFGKDSGARVRLDDDAGQHARQDPRTTTTARAGRVPRVDRATGEELRMRRATPAALTACALLAAVALTGCGGDDEPQAAPPSPSVSAEPTPSRTPSPSPARTPLSRFEDRPEVRVLRTWGLAYAKAINAGNRQYPTLRPLMTGSGFQGLVKYIAPDDEGLYYPGPVPFTPTAVKGAGGTARVPACTWTQGWAQDPATKKPARPKQVRSSYFTVQREDGRWKVSGFYINEENTCAQSSVKGVRW